MQQRPGRGSGFYHAAEAPAEPEPLLPGRGSCITQVWEWGEITAPIGLVVHACKHMCVERTGGRGQDYPYIPAR